MNNRKRNVQIKFRVTEEERSLIEEKNETGAYKKYGSVPSENGDRRIYHSGRSQRYKEN